jgi:hypothetical protein
MADRLGYSRPVRRCGECDQLRTAHARARDGEPDLCFRCWKLGKARCSICGEYRRCYWARQVRPMCPRCLPEPRAGCSHCEKRGQIAALTDRGPQCLACWRAAQNGRHACRRCRRWRRPAAWIDGTPVCAACNGTGTIRYCQDCGAAGRDYRSKRCHRCALHHTLQELREHADPDAVAELEPLLRRLEQHKRPRSALAWLQRSPAAPTFVGMLRGEIRISHHALDEHDAGQATAYLRSWLVIHGVLEVREERLARFERWAQTTLEAISEHPDHAHLAAYARWELQPDFARRLRRGVARANSHKHLYGKLRVAVHLTAFLHRQGLSLADLRQSHVDEWLAGVPARVVPTRAFVDWLHRAGLIPRITAVRPAPGTSTTPIDHGTRLRQARDLLHDDALELPARIGGCLLLLYGQPVTRIVTLRLDQIRLDPERVRIQLGDEPIELPPPLASLVRQQHIEAAGPWLFPGAKPGTHLGPERLQRRLHELGIHAGIARAGALLALAAAVPAPILAELLGYHDDTTNHWRRVAAGDWARYASLASTPSA